MASLKIFLFGSPALQLNGTPVKTERNKALALLSYLAVQGKSYQREDLAALLWPDSNKSSAFAYLRRALYDLKTALGNGWLEANPDTICLSPQASTWIDVVYYRTLFKQVKDHLHPEGQLCSECLSSLTEAVELYRGDFMAGFSLPDSAAFDAMNNPWGSKNWPNTISRTRMQRKLSNMPGTAWCSIP
jgi:two-component SAPR family response regulator